MCLADRIAVLFALFVVGVFFLCTSVFIPSGPEAAAAMQAQLYDPAIWWRIVKFLLGVWLVLRVIDLVAGGHARRWNRKHGAVKATILNR
jgi:hypothetical protein